MECSIATTLVFDETKLRDVEEDGCIDGPIIQTTIPGVHYHISVFPNDNIDDEERKVACYLYVNSKMPVTGKYTFSIPSANFSQTLSYLFEEDDDGEDDGNGKHAFSRDSFFDPAKRYFQNGKLTLQLRGTFKCDKLNEIKLGKTVGQLFMEKDDKDFTIEVDDKEIKAHKLILRERSPYFAAMFDSGMKESIENKVKIEGFPFKVVETAIKICYDCKPNCYFYTDDLLLVLKFSDVYDIAVVKTFAEFKLSYFIRPSNICRIANASIEYNAENLRLFCINDLIKYSKNADDVTDFDSLDVNFKADVASKSICHKTVLE